MCGYNRIHYFISICALFRVLRRICEGLWVSVWCGLTAEKRSSSFCLSRLMWDNRRNNRYGIRCSSKNLTEQFELFNCINMTATCGHELGFDEDSITPLISIDGRNGQHYLKALYHGLDSRMFTTRGWYRFLNDSRWIYSHCQARNSVNNVIAAKCRIGSGGNASSER